MDKEMNSFPDLNTGLYVDNRLPFHSLGPIPSPQLSPQMDVSSASRNGNSLISPIPRSKRKRTDSSSHEDWPTGTPLPKHTIDAGIVVKDKASIFLLDVSLTP